MNPLYWVAWSGACAGGTGILVYFIMQSRTEVLLSRQREELAAAKATLAAHKETLENLLRFVEESARLKALNEFLTEIRVEERQYVREQKILFGTKKSMIRQERIYFRNIPLTSWVEHETPYEEGVDEEKLTQTATAFPSEDFTDGIKLLR